MKGLKTLIDFIKNNKYTWILIYLIFYLIIFFVLDVAIGAVGAKHILHLPIDDQIPFISAFFFPYMLWFPMLILLLIEFMLRDKQDFVNYWFMMFTGMNICFLVYIIWPNGLNLRVEVAESDVLGQLMSMIWSLDPPVNVCPSLHVTSSITAMIAVCSAKHMKGMWFKKLVICIFFLVVIASTVFLKQHSVIDLLAGLAVAVFMAVITWFTPWKKLFRGRFKVLVD